MVQDKSYCSKFLITLGLTSVVILGLIIQVFAADELLPLKYKFGISFKGMEENSFEIYSINIGSNRTEVRVQTYDGNINLKPGKTTFYNMTIRRPFIPNDELGLWRKDIIQGKFLKKDGVVQITDITGEVVAEYAFTGAWPCEQRLDAFQSVESPVMETLTFVTETMVRKK